MQEPKTIAKHIIYILFILMIPSVLSGQDIQVTRISNDVIVLHPRIIDDINVIRKVGGNMTAIRTDSGIVVVDSFISPEAGAQARRQIENHFPNLPIKYLINTHHHADHVRGNDSFSEACVIAHANLTSHSTIFPTLKIASDYAFSLGGKIFEIRYFGSAHTDNDLVLLDRADKLLIMGDLLCHRKCRILGSLSNAENWIALLDNLIRQSGDYEYVIPGHGGVVLNGDALVEQRNYLKDLCNAVQNARKIDMTLEEAKNEIRLEKYKSYTMLDQIEDDIEAYWHQIEKYQLDGNE